MRAFEFVRSLTLDFNENINCVGETAGPVCVDDVLLHVAVAYAGTLSWTDAPEKDRPAAESKAGLPGICRLSSKTSISRIWADAGLVLNISTDKQCHWHLEFQSPIQIMPDLRLANCGY